MDTINEAPSVSLALIDPISDGLHKELILQRFLEKQRDILCQFRDVILCVYERLREYKSVCVLLRVCVRVPFQSDYFARTAAAHLSWIGEQMARNKITLAQACILILTFFYWPKIITWSSRLEKRGGGAV